MAEGIEARIKVLKRWHRKVETSYKTGSNGLAIAVDGAAMISLAAMIEASEAELAEAKKAIDFYAGRYAERCGDVARLRGLLGEAEGALEWYAEACTINNKDDDEDIDDSLAATKITFGQLRLARTTLAKLRAETGGGEE